MTKIKTKFLDFDLDTLENINGSLTVKSPFDPLGDYSNLRARGTLAEDVGLDQVDNTSDLDKPISTAQQTALDLKVTSDEVISILDSSLIGGDNLTIIYDNVLDTFTFNATGGAADNYYLDGLTFDGATGTLTASVSGTTNQTVNIDGRYSLLGHTHTFLDEGGTNEVSAQEIREKVDEEFSSIEFSPSDPLISADPDTYTMSMKAEGTSPSKILTHYMINELEEEIIIATTVV